MYCTNCGKEIQEGEHYCGGCGTKMTESKTVKVCESAKSANGAALNESATSVIDKIMHAGENKISMILACILPVISILLLGATMFGISFEVLGYSETLDFSMFGEQDFLKTLFYIGYIATFVMIVLPAFKDGKWKGWNFIPGMIIPIVSGIIFAITIIHAKDQIASGQYASIVKAINLQVRISQNGWIFLVTSIASVLATADAYLGIALKKARSTRNKE